MWRHCGPTPPRRRRRKACRAEGHAILLAERQNLLHGAPHRGMVVVARMSELDGGVSGSHVAHVDPGQAQDLLRVLVPAHRFQMHHHRGLLVLLVHPALPVGDFPVVAVAPSRRHGPRSRRRELEIAQQPLDLLPGLGPGELDAHHSRFQQLRDLLPLQLGRLGDGGQPVVAGGENGVGQVLQVEEAVLVLDVDEVESRVPEQLDEGRMGIRLQHGADQHLTPLQPSLEMPPRPSLRVPGVVDSDAGLARLGHSLSL